MNKKIIFSVSLIFALSAFFSLPAKAEDNSLISIPLTPDTAVSSPSAEMIPQSINAEKKISNLVTRAYNLISSRTSSLAVLGDKINKSNLTGEQKMSLFGKINTQTSKLNELYNKIKINKNVKDTRALVKTIYTDFRIYAVFIPKIHTLMALHTLTNHLARFTTLLVQVQLKIDALKEKGINVDARQKLLDQAKKIVPEIQAKINSTIKTVDDIKPADYPASKNTFAASRTSIKTLRSMFFNIRKLLTDTKLAK